MKDNQKELQRYKHEVHCYLDILWLISSNKSQARSSWYNWLSLQMNKNKENTHVSQFTLEDCKQALRILKRKYKQLTGKNNISKSVKRKINGNKINIKEII